MYAARRFTKIMPWKVKVKPKPKVALWPVTLWSKE